MPAKLDRVLATLEKTFGRIRAPRRARAYDLLVLASCGYPASEDACQRGWDALERTVGTSPAEILAAPKAKLVAALRAGGIMPELRADRVKLVAATATSGADLRDRKTLKKLPTIGDPGADKILLFTHVEPIAAVPSNATQVLVRIGIAREGTSYAATYRATQQALDAQLPAAFAPRIRAHLLVKRHGQDICKRTRPLCDRCPLTRQCDYFMSSVIAASRSA